MNNTDGAGDRSITASASRVMIGGVLSLLGGLASNVIVAAMFGAGADMDAYLTAMVIPAYFQIVFFSSLSFVLIPAFIDAETKQGEDDAWALVGTYFWLTTIILLFISILGSLASAQIINLIAPGFHSEKSALAARMLSVLMFTTLFTGLSTMTVGIQNARNHFFWPSVSPAFGALANVIVLLTISAWTGSMALAWGYLASMMVQCGFTVVPIVAHGWKQPLPLKDARVREIGQLIIPLILFGLLISLSPVAERYFASGLPDGQIAYMGYANKISSIFVLLLASGIAAAIFPSMARTHAQGGTAALADMNDYGMRLTFAVSLPVIFLVWALGMPLLGILFERGAFKYVDTLGVNLIIFPFLLGDVLFRMAGNILQRSYYVLKDTLTQSLVSSVFVILFILFARYFVIRWGYVGLVWAATIRKGLGVLTAWALLRRKLPESNLWNTLSFTAKYLAAALVAFGAARYVLFMSLSMPLILQLLTGGLTGGLLYVLLLYAFDKAILLSIAEMLGSRFLLHGARSLKKRTTS